MSWIKDQISHELKGVEHSPKRWEEFGLLVGTVLCYVGLFFESGRVGIVLLGLVVFVVGLTRPAWLARPYTWWMVFGTVLGYSVSRFLLTAVYVLVVTPIGLGMRLFSGDPLRRKQEPNNHSYWQPYNHS